MRTHHIIKIIFVLLYIFNMWEYGNLTYCYNSMPDSLSFTMIPNALLIVFIILLIIEMKTSPNKNEGNREKSVSPMKEARQ